MGKSRRKKWRVYQFLVSMGAVRSKKEAASLAHSGKILVDGKIMSSLYYQIDPRKEKVTINGKSVKLTENRKYFVLNKPFGVECTKENILLFFDKVAPDVRRSLTPVGRLDKNSSGLLIVTNDGRLVRRVLDPLTKRVKWYHVKVKGVVNSQTVESLRKGVTIDLEENGVVHKYQTMPAKVRVIAQAPPVILEFGLLEGKKRQVRRMCEAVGLRVTALERFAIAKLTLKDLCPGKIKEYSKEKMYRLLFE